MAQNTSFSSPLFSFQTNYSPPTTNVLTFPANNATVASRLIDWTQAGLGTSGIPVVSTIYTTIQSGASEAQIQTALDACPSNQVVVLSNGTYSISSTLFIRQTGEVLRGFDPTNVILAAASGVYNDVMVNVGSIEGALTYIGATCSGYTEQESNFSNNWIAGFGPGTTSIYVAANSTTQSLAVGMVIGIDQIDDGVNVVAPNGGTSGQDFRYCGSRSLQEVKVITSLATNQIGISPGLYSPYWAIGNVPAIWWPSSTRNSYVSLVGIENLTLNGEFQPARVLSFGGAYRCWGKNLTVLSGGGFGTGQSIIYPSFTVNCEVNHCLITGQPQPSNSGQYCMYPHNTSAFRMEDCMITNYYGAVLMVGTSGSVFDYNYFTNDLSEASPGNTGCGCDDPTPNLMAHGGQCNYNLFEGNYVRHKEYYNLYGYETYGMLFRNRIMGQENLAYTNIPGNCCSFKPVRLMENSWYETFLGNILGVTNFSNPYQGAIGGNDVYSMAGTNGTYSPPTGDVQDTDPKVTNTLFRAGNWDVVSGSNVWANAPQQTMTNTLAMDVNRVARYTGGCSTCPFPPFQIENLGASTNALSVTNLWAARREIYGPRF